MRKKLLGLVASLAAAAASQASITLETQFANLYDADGITQIGAGKIGILVADTDGTGITNAMNTVLTEGTFLGGSSDDLIVKVFTSINNVADFSGSSGFSDVSVITYSGNFTAGDNLYLLWFPTLTTAGSTVVDGTAYGVYRSDNVNTASGSDIAFVAPPDDNGVYTLAVFDNSLVPASGVTTSDLTANQVAAVPEPSSTAILVMVGIGVVLIQIRRMRRVE